MISSCFYNNKAVMNHRSVCRYGNWWGSLHWITD